MAIKTPLIDARQQIQEQGKQQRQTQQQRFVQNLGQTILGSALQLGTTLGVEHFKETRPSVLKRNEALDEKINTWAQARKQAADQHEEWKGFAGARKTETGQKIALSEQKLTEGTLKQGKWRAQASELNMQMDEKGNLYFLGDTPSPALDLGTSGGVDYAAMAKAPGLPGTESSAGFPRALTDERLEKEDKALDPRKIFLDTPDGAALAKKNIAAFREAALDMGVIKPGESKNRSTDWLLGKIQSSASKSHAPRSAYSKAARSFMNDPLYAQIRAKLKPHRAALNRAFEGADPGSLNEAVSLIGGDLNEVEAKDLMHVTELAKELQLKYPNQRVPSALGIFRGLPQAGVRKDPGFKDKQHAAVAVLIDPRMGGVPAGDMVDQGLESLASILPNFSFDNQEDRTAFLLAAGQLTGVTQINPDTLDIMSGDRIGSTDHAIRLVTRFLSDLPADEAMRSQQIFGNLIGRLRDDLSLSDRTAIGTSDEIKALLEQLAPVRGGLGR